MLIYTKSTENPSDIQSSEITPREVFENRRAFIKAASAGIVAASMFGASRFSQAGEAKSPVLYNPHQKIGNYTKTNYGADEKVAKYEDATTYNNYYEFGTSKSDPAIESTLFKPRPWTISIEGEVKKAKTIGIDDLMKLAPLEERIYRLRCVEAWSMVIPWIGLPLASLVKWAEPTANAKYVEFISANDPATMPGARVPVLEWPYIEGLRIDEAVNPLTLLAVGMYGELLPNQNGAPVRLVAPWKYGFKGAKAIVKICFVEKMPQTSWMKAGPSEYGFYANVNPEVDHPRWTQSSEKRIGAGLFAGRIKTKMFNGYADQVAHMYAGMDLRKFF